MNRYTVLIAAVCLVGCDKSPPQAPAPTDATQPVATAPDASVTANAAPDAAAHNSRREVREHMREHWGLAVVVRDAVIAATLDELPDVAGELADHKAPDSLSSFAKPIAAMRSAAERAQKAPSTTEAATAVADLARACGDCHVAAGAGPTLPAEPLPPDEDATKAHMLRHDVAARELWAGLVIPSDERWAKGAALLEAKPLHRGDFFEDWEITEALIGLDKNVHQLRKRAAAAATRPERVAIFGELISNCATCHAATAEGPVD